MAIYLQLGPRLDSLRGIPRYTNQWFAESDNAVAENIHWSNYKYGDYERLATKFDIVHFKKLPEDQRCVAFFEDLLEAHPDWRLWAYQKGVDVFERRVLQKLRYFREQLREIRDGDAERPGTRSENATVETDFEDAMANTLKTEQKMADFIATMRVFQRCFVDGWVPAGQEPQLYSKLTARVLPFLTNKLPEFVYESATLVDGFPQVDRFEVKHPYTGTNMIEYIRKNSHGKGIVLSASSKHGRDLVKLIRLLRALDNKLPIQIVHRGDLSQRNQNFINYAATADKDTLLLPTTFYRWTKVWPDVDLAANLTTYGVQFLPQKVTFVNIKPAVSNEFKHKFPGFANKLLALLFTSFRHVLLLDADAVPLVNPDHFFHSQEYSDTGTFFFKDRTLRDTNEYMETNFFAKLFPTPNEHTLEEVFGIQQATHHSLANTYMAGYRHYQEAGVVAIDKVQHLLGVIMTFPLALWREPVSSAIWGEKEMYWLGLSMAGDENYRFNKYPAASVGELTSPKDRSYYPDARGGEVCSSHPGHIDSKNTLLWMNSGFSFCKKNNEGKDKKYFPFNTMDLLNELAPLYESPQIITHGIIPPEEPMLRGIYESYDQTSQQQHMDMWKLQKEVDDVDRSKVPFVEGRDPLKGWMKNPICTGYQYCAYNEITMMDQTKQLGLLVSFDKTLVEFYRFLGKVWLSGAARVSA